MTTISNFTFISIEKYKEISKTSGTHFEHSPGNLAHWVKIRNEGRECNVCGNSPIWAKGSESVGWAGCFTCITGETDASEDYDVA